MKKILLIGLMLTTIFAAGCQSQDREIKSLDDLKTARIGVWAGSGYEFVARQALPDANYLYLDSVSDFLQNLAQGKIDAFIIGKVYLNNFKNEGIDVNFVEEPLGKIPIGFVFPKNSTGEKLSAQMNEFLAKLEESGELDELKTKWITGDESSRHFEKATLTGENGTIRIGTDAVKVPYAYLKDEKVIGYEAEIFDKFCAAYGYNYNVNIEAFQAILFDFNFGKLDMAMTGAEILDSRKDSLIFSNPQYVDEVVAVTNVDLSGGKNFFASIAERIKHTLIDEDRWKMLLEGLGVTILLITNSTILGTTIGLLLYMIYREKIKIVNKFFEAQITLFTGLPTIVIMLVFYYVIFGSVKIDGLIVVIIAFTYLSSFNVMMMLRSGEKAISKGQLEAASALGFSERRGFIKFILPQIAQILFPSYQGAILAYMRGTAIVGYVAVQDLTRMADLIRARTFDAFIPIIIISIMYFLLSWIIIKVTNVFLKWINPRNRNRDDILKDVKIN